MDETSIRSKMQPILEAVVTDIASIRTGRASPSIVQNLVVAVYGGGQRLRISELTTISLSDAQTIVIDPWDKSIIGEIRQGIMAANVGLTPNIDGEVIRISLPPLTTEDREKYVKVLSQKLETGKVMIRQVRSEAMKDVARAFEAKEFGEDDKFAREKKVQGITDEFITKIEGVGEKKKQELLQI